MEKKYSLLFVAVAFVPGFIAYPSGPPASACLSMTPGHGYAPQNTPCPFILNANVNCYSLGQRILLTLRDPTPKIEDFKGLFVQARQTSSMPVNSYGKFDTNNDINLQTINCFGGIDNSLGHTNNANKTQVTFGWTAPSSNFFGPIVFKYTVVEDFSKFWVGEEFVLPQCSSPASSTQSSNAVTRPSTTVTRPTNGVTRPSTTVPRPSNGVTRSTTTVTRSTYRLFSTTTSPCMDKDPICSYFDLKESGKCGNAYVKSFCCASCSRSETPRQPSRLESSDSDSDNDSRGR